MDRHVRFLAQKILLSTPCLPTPSQCPPRAQHGSTRIKHNGYRLIADATAIGSGTTLPGATIGRTGKRVYIGLSERACLPLSTGSASQGGRRGGNGGWRLGLWRARRTASSGLCPCSVMQFGLPTVPRQHRHFPERCIWSPAMGPSVRPAPCSPIQLF